jgi:hypothetical protein
MDKVVNGAWAHAGRLPLGCGWSGQCTAPGHEGEIPSPQDLQEFCNLGYAAGCARLPAERSWDSIRFGARSVASEAVGENIQIRYICECGHLPAEHGILEFAASTAQCERPHRDSRLQRMAECFVETYLEKRKHQELGRSAAG